MQSASGRFDVRLPLILPSAWRSGSPVRRATYQGEGRGCRQSDSSGDHSRLDSCSGALLFLCSLAHHGARGAEGPSGASTWSCCKAMRADTRQPRFQGASRSIYPFLYFLRVLDIRLDPSSSRTKHPVLLVLEILHRYPLAPSGCFRRSFSHLRRCDAERSRDGP